MSDVGRLKDEGDAFERALLTSARRDQMSPSARRALLASVASGAAAGTLAAKGGGSATATVKGLVLVKWIAIAAVGGALVAAATIPFVRGHRAAPAPSTVMAPAEAIAPPPAAPAEVPATPLPSPAVAPSKPAAAPPRHATSAPRASSSGDSNDATSLAAELRLIEQARAALAAGRPRDALTALDEHRARFGRGALAEEAAVLRIEAHARAGDASAARSLARAFFASRPRSQYTARVQRVIAGLDADGAR